MSEHEFNKPIPYQLHISDELLDLTKKKLQLARFPDEQNDVGDDDWSQGAKVKVVKRLAEYWSEGYDWRAEEVSNRSLGNSIQIADGLQGLHQCRIQSIQGQDRYP